MSAHAMKATNVFEKLVEEARRGEVLVADVYSAMRRKEISEDQARQILIAFERARASGWVKVFG